MINWIFDNFLGLFATAVALMTLLFGGLYLHDEIEAVRFDWPINRKYLTLSIVLLLVSALFSFLALVEFGLIQ